MPTVFARGEAGYHTFRSPSLVRTATGDVLAFAQGRLHDASDDGDIDLFMRRSTDGGRTWGPLQLIWDDGPNKVGPTAPVVDQATGDIVLLAIRTAGHVSSEDINAGRTTWEESRRPFVLRSTDNGETWSDPVEITDSVKRRDWRHFVFGPGHAIQLTRGEHAGRIVAPGNHTAAPPDGSDDTGVEPKYHGVHLAYSDDGGYTWQLGAIDEAYDDHVNGDESQVVELTDGTLYQSLRDQHGSAPSNRGYVLSRDGGGSYAGKLVPEEQLETSVVQGTVQRIFARDQGDDSDLLVFSSAKEFDMPREHMALWRSTDEGKTWTEALTVWDGRAAYSDLVALPDERLGLIYEAGSTSPYEEICFVRIPIDNVTP